MVLSPSEADDYERVGTDTIVTLARDVSGSPGSYSGRAMDGFLARTKVRDAIERWHAQPSRSD
jgi:hypothetical protein